MEGKSCHFNKLRKKCVAQKLFNFGRNGIVMVTLTFVCKRLEKVSKVV